MPAAEHAVELAAAGRDPLDGERLDLAEGHGRARLAASAARLGRRLPRKRSPLSAARGSSCSVFHSPQPGQRPIHLGLSCPQAVHANLATTRTIFC